MPTYFTEVFQISPETLEEYGAFDISLVTDLPLFIDPFLLYGSQKDEYKALHDSIIDYLIFLRDKAAQGKITDGQLQSWYFFREVKQNWLGFSISDNGGRGLAKDFATALHSNLGQIFSDFGKEAGVTDSSHLEKVCLIRDGVGRDKISDFTTNLIKYFLCEYTENFARLFIPEPQRRLVSVPKAKFNKLTERWEAATFTLPWYGDDYVLLTPRDILTRDDTWINRNDLIRRFDELPPAVEDSQLREEISAHFERCIEYQDDKEPTQKELDKAAIETIKAFPTLLDHYIALKEDQGEEAQSASSEKVATAERIFHSQILILQQLLYAHSKFYSTGRNSHDEAITRANYMKDVIENKGGHRIFYNAGVPIKRESDLQIMYRLVWIGTPSDVSAEVNDGRGPADYKVSRGANDKTIIEMKLASNSKLERNLEKQAEIYKAASDAKNSVKIILFFSVEEQVKVKKILRKLGLEKRKDVILIDGRGDNKPSGSKA